MTLVSLYFEEFLGPSLVFTFVFEARLNFFVDAALILDIVVTLRQQFFADTLLLTLNVFVK